MGMRDDYKDILRFHGTSPSRYKEINRCTDTDIPEALVFLWEADMHVDQSGEDVGYEARLKDIGERLGFDSEPYNICSETIRWLIDHGLS